MGNPSYEILMAEANDLDDLLSKPLLLDAYFDALKHHFSPAPFSRKSFDAILHQLVDLKSAVPEIKNRLWETSDLGQEISIPANILTYGRTLDAHNWHGFLSHWLSSLRSGAAPITRIRNDLERTAYILSVLRSVGERRTDFSSREMSKRNTRRSAPSYYRAMLEDQQIDAVASYLLLHCITWAPHWEKLNSEDADVVLNLINDLKTTTDSLTVGSVNTSSIQFAMRPKIPSIRQLLASQTLFPTLPNGQSQIRRATGLVYRFAPIPRRLHGIWGGATVPDCVGGAPEYLDSLTPERWAICALKKSRFFHVLKSLDNGKCQKYAGFIQGIPLRDLKTERHYCSMEWMTPILFKKVFDNRQVTSVYSLFLEKFLNAERENFSGVAVGDTNTFNFYGVLDEVRRTPQYLFGQNRSVQNFLHVDSKMAWKIVAASPKRGLAIDYGGKMITDAQVPGTRRLTLLDENVKCANSPVHLQILKNRLQQGQNASLRWSAALALMRLDSHDLEAVHEVIAAVSDGIAFGWKRYLEPPFHYLNQTTRKIFRLPPKRRKNLEIWETSIAELGNYAVMNRDILDKKEIFSTQKRALGEAINKLIAASLYGRNITVRLSAIRTLGELDWKDPKLLRALHKLAKPSWYPVLRSFTQEIQKAAQHALITLDPTAKTAPKIRLLDHVRLLLETRRAALSLPLRASYA